MRARFQALLVGLVLFSAAAVVFVVWAPSAKQVPDEQGLPGLLQTAKLTSMAAWVAAHNGDPHPQRATVYATTRAHFRHTLEGGVFHDPRPIYVVDLRGSFTVEHSAPAGVSPITHGTQILLVYDRKTLEETDTYVGSESDLSKLGHGRRLQVP